MRQPVLLFILKSEMDWHRNSRQAPWKLSSTDANRAMHSLRSRYGALTLSPVGGAPMFYISVHVANCERRVITSSIVKNSWFFLLNGQ